MYNLVTVKFYNHIIIFNNIRTVIINNKGSINLNLIGKSRKITYKKTLRKDDNIKGNLNNNMIRKSIYIFSQIIYIKTKIYKRYIYIC